MTYQGIIERVRAATGADAQIDAEIYATVGGAPHTTTAGARTIPLVRRGDPTIWPEYTASIDAALALAEKVLPDANCYGVEREPEGWTAYMSRNNVKTGHWMKEAQAPTAPLAIILATLLALQSQEPK